MDTNSHELILKEEVYAAVEAAMEVSSELGCGFLEAVYQEALAIEFSLRKIPFTSQPRINLQYKNHSLEKEYIPDFLCFNQVIIEIKSVKALSPIEDAQLLNYLKATRKPVGLLLNFGKPKLEWKRFVQ